MTDLIHPSTKNKLIRKCNIFEHSLERYRSQLNLSSLQMKTMKSGLVRRHDCNERTSTDEVGKFLETFSSRLSMI